MEFGAPSQEVLFLIICMQCGHQNEGHNLKNCQNCGALLPRMDTSAMVRVEEESGQVKQFSEAVEKVRSGEWDQEQFYEFLSGVFERLGNLRAEIEEIIVENKYDEYANEEVEQGLQGGAVVGMPDQPDKVHLSAHEHELLGKAVAGKVREMMAR